MANENAAATQDEALVRYFSNFDDKVEMMLALVDTREWTGYGEISTHINLLEVLAAIVLNPSYVRLYMELQRTRIHAGMVCKIQLWGNLHASHSA